MVENSSLVDCKFIVSKIVLTKNQICMFLMADWARFMAHSVCNNSIYESNIAKLQGAK